MAVESLPFTLFEHLKSEKHPRTGAPRKRTMRFDINALADFEQEAGMGFGQLMSTKALFATARALAWAGMRHEDRGITVAAVGTKIQEYMAEGGAVDEILTELFTIAQKQGAFGRMAEEVAYGDAPGLPAGGDVIEGEAKAVTVPPTPSPVAAHSENQ